MCRVVGAGVGSRRAPKPGSQTPTALYQNPFLDLEPGSPGQFAVQRFERAVAFQDPTCLSRENAEAVPAGGQISVRQFRSRNGTGSQNGGTVKRFEIQEVIIGGTILISSDVIDDVSTRMTYAFFLPLRFSFSSAELVANRNFKTPT